MGTQENKRIARVLMDDLFCETAYAFYDPGYKFGHMIDYEVAPIRGEGAQGGPATDRRSAMTFVEQNRLTGEALKAIYPDGSTRALKSITAEGDRVICEYLTHGGRNIFRRDAEHNFHTVKVFDFKEGKVVAVREYTDTAYLVSFGPQIAEFTNAFLNGRAGEGAAESFAWGRSWLFSAPVMELGQPSEFGSDEGGEANKVIVMGMIDSWGGPAMIDALAETVMMSNEVDLVTTPTLGRSLHGRDEVAASCARERDIFPDGLSREVTTMTAEENRVVVEATFRGISTVRPDQPFETRVLTIFFLRDSRVFRVRQYLDSAFWQNYSAEMVDHIFGGGTEQILTRLSRTLSTSRR